MGFLNFGRSRTPSQSQIIYTDNVRRKSSFSLIVSDSENKDIDFEEISKHIATFEENASNENEIGNVIIDKNGNFMVVTELGANFIFKERLVVSTALGLVGSLKITSSVSSKERTISDFFYSDWHFFAP